MFMLLVLACGASVPQFIVENKCPAFSVANRIPAVKATTTKTAVSYRQPTSHTHTCPKCGLTWDHQANPGHVCKACGTPQYVQDTRPKLVPVAAAKPTTTTPAAKKPTLAFPLNPYSDCPSCRQSR